MTELETVQDYNSPDFGLPEYYSIRADNLGYNVRVHHSRIVRFTGRDLPYIERLGETYWGASELEHVFDELKKRDNTSFNIASLVFRANLHVYKKEGFEEISLMPDTIKKRLFDELSLLNAMMNNNGTQIIGNKDTLETRQYTFGGLSEIYELFMMDIAGAAEIPVTKLFGRSPAGMNATGESDMQNYYDSIEEKQESDLRPVYDVLLPVMCMSAFGAIPDDFDYDFESVRRPTEDERKTLAGQIGTAVTSVFTAGIISQKTALTELRNSTELTGMWQSITDEDIETADTTIMGGDLPLPDIFGASNALVTKEPENLENSQAENIFSRKGAQ
jgi:phage-related protein (TIGR01555 family)